MRHLALVIMLLACAADMGAQEQTLFKDSTDKGGFGGPVAKFTSLYNQNALMIGGRGG